MDLDPLSIVTPARVKVLLLPIGNVKRSRFASFVARLQNVNVVRLGDVSPDSRPYRTMFSPLAFPEGLVLYDLSTSLTPSSHLALAPFEIYRETFIILGIADKLDLVDESTCKGSSKAGNALEAMSEPHALKDGAFESLSHDVEGLRLEYPRALVHQILVFDCDGAKLPDAVRSVPSLKNSKTTTIKTIMCDLTSLLLAEMTTYARTLQDLSLLEVPRVSSDPPIASEPASGLPPHMISQSKTASIASISRSSSPSEGKSRSDQQGSMPEQASTVMSSQLSTPDGRPVTPVNGERTPPSAFSELARPSSVQSPPKPSIRERPSAGSQDRLSSSSLNLGERERNKGKGRIGVVIGAMYLLAGRWPDAAKELVQSVTVARSHSDYVWHAKALDYLLVCFLMCAWAGMDFRIPDVLSPGAEKLGSSSSKLTHQTQSNFSELSISRSTDPEKRASTLRKFTSIMPDLSNNILNLYSRAWTFTDDKLPPLAFSHSCIRFAKLLAAINLSYGILDDGLLGHIVLNVDLSRHESRPPDSVHFLAKEDISNLLFRAYPSSPDLTTSTADRTIILAAIASVLSRLGYQRKKALVLKEIMSNLLPALVQARKDGAAEMGVHPAASLASLNATIQAVPLDGFESVFGQTEQGMRDFLYLISRSYGIVSPEHKGGRNNSVVSVYPQASSKSSITVTNAQSAEYAVTRVLQQAQSQTCGSKDLKMDILRSCINICEALPDLSGALHFSVELLRVGGSGVAPGPDSSAGSPDLPIDEQIRLSSNISRTLSAARQLGLDLLEADYWDEFLIREIEIVKANAPKNLLPHAKSELDTAETFDTREGKNPFIYNPFFKAKIASVPEQLLVADEESMFRVTLQNLYDFDVVVERMKLISDGVGLDCQPQATVIGPYRMQSMLLSGRPLAAGSLIIRGCTAKVKGCRERDFPTFSDSWALKPDMKGIYIGTASKSKTRATASDSDKSKLVRPPKGPRTKVLTLKVVAAQPTVSVRAVSLPQSAVMLLEGETKTFSVTLHNTSQKTYVDFLLLSFDDSISQKRQSALASKGLSPLELYEIELALANHRSFRWLNRDRDKDLTIPPGEDLVLDIEVLGRLGLSYGSIQVDYGHLGVSSKDIKDQFYTRQLRIPITVTVKVAVEVVDIDVIKPSPQFMTREETVGMTDGMNLSAEIPQYGLESLIQRLNPSTSSSADCMLLLDLRNSWSSPLRLNLKVLSTVAGTNESSVSIANPSDASRSSYTIMEPIHPGTTLRLPLSLPRLYIPYPYAPIPSLDPAHKRQFVVSATKTDPEAERATREAFWYREAVLQRLEATWKEDSTGRAGTIDLRSLQLTPRMVSALKLPDLSIQLSVTTATVLPTDDGSNDNTKHPSLTSFSVPTSSFLTLHTTLFNRSPNPIRPFLRLQPSLANQPPNVALDLSRSLLVHGVLQQALPALGPGESTIIETGFVLLSQGVYEWGGCVEEMVTPRQANTSEREVPSRARAATGEFDVLADMGRRVWGVEEACTIIARDGASDAHDDGD